MLAHRVREVIASVFHTTEDKLPPEISPDTVAGWNSFRHIRVIIALEQEFGLEIDPDLLPVLTNGDAILDYLGRRLGAGAHA
jgi:acyl carrier protein